MQLILWPGAACLGAVIGSFLNVCIHRIPRGESVVSPPSHCPRCGGRIRWYDNIPIASYLLLGGRCRHCKERISLRYPLVEGLSALFAVLVLLRFGLTAPAFIYYLFLAALIVVTFVDLDHRIIPNVITYPGIPLGILASLLLPARDLVGALVGAALGGGILLAVALLFEWIRKKEGMGFGDVKLLAMIGAFLGWKAVVFTLVVSSFTGLLVGYTALRLSGKDRDHPIPYGPFLALGAVLYLWGGDAWMEWYLHGMK